MIRNDSLIRFADHLIEEEKSRATVEKYLRDARKFAEYLGERPLTKQETVRYKAWLAERYEVTSVNSMLVSLNTFLRFLDHHECCVRLLKVQKQIFAGEERELSTGEYRRLLQVAQGTRLELVMQTICETGIRVSELRYITVEAVMQGRCTVACKSKSRVILIPSSLRKRLLPYIKKSGLKTGSVFLTKRGRPLDRSNIWRDMKALCERAGVAPSKVFPHNLRHLFARTFYAIDRDIVRLADLLGHSSINTTRIYTMETGKRHLDCLERVHRRLMT